MKNAPAWANVSRKIIRRLPRGRYPIMNWICKRQVAPFCGSFGINGDHLRFICDLGDAIAREAWFMGLYEPQETALFHDLLRPGMCVVDVGANWGYYTLLASEMVGTSGRVISLEPHPTLFGLLKRNVSLNSLTNVTALCIAAADRNGDMNLAGFDESQSNSGTSHLTDIATVGRANYQVKARLLEPLLDAQDVGEVDLLKMDIEGGEGLVVPTLVAGLARERFKHILLELHPAALKDMNVSASRLIQTILDFNYRAWQIDHSRQTTIRAAYQLPNSARTFLTGFNGNAVLNDWPHMLFVAPSVAPTW